jgi:hypothetical protein
MQGIPEQLLAHSAAERMHERRTCQGAPPPSPRTPPARRRAAGALRRFADRLDGVD